MSDTDTQRTPLAVSIAAVSSFERFRHCLRSLKPALEGFATEVFVTENGSGYDTETEARSFFPKAVIFKNVKPLSLGACHNQALREAKADRILMLRDDVEMFPRMLQQLVISLDRHPKAAVTGPTFYPGSWDAKPASSGWELNDWLPTSIRIPLYYLSQELGGRLFFEPRITDSTLKEIELAYVNGFCSLAKREALLEAGGFDEAYFLYLEDCDLGHRLRQKGYKLYQAEGAKCLFREKAAYTESWKKFFEDLKRYNRKNSNLLVASLSRLIQGILGLVVRLKGELDEPVSLTEKEFNKILIYTTGSSRDFLLITPALRALRKRYPEAEIVLLGNSPEVHTLDFFPGINAIRELPASFGLHPLLFLWQTMDPRTKGFLKDLSVERWDLFVEFQGLFSWLDLVKPWILASYSRAEWRLGLDTDSKGVFLTHRIKDSRERLLHGTRRYGEVASAVGAIPDDFKTALVLQEADDAFARGWLETEGVHADDLLIVVHTMGEVDHLKRTSWSRHYFIDLLNQLSERYPAKIVLTSGSDVREINWVNSIRDAVSPAPLLTPPEMTRTQLAALLKRAGLALMNDSDLLHTALAVNCPVIGIFGPGNYQLYASYGEERDLTAFYRPIDCRPCVNSYCADPVCLKSITPEMVFEAIGQKIESLQIRT